MRTITRFFALVLLLADLGLSVAYAEMVPGADINSVPEAKRVAALLRQPEKDMDLARVKLSMDKMIDPTIEVDAGVKQIDDMAAQVRAMLRGFPSSNARLQALRVYLYEKGPWNSYQSYSYDFSDPLGNNIRNKLLLNYIASKKGNCVTMPLLFVILGQRLGLDVTISTVPYHLFVKYTEPETGITYNLEATNGATTARDMWIRQQNPMTNEAIANGLYMQKLTKREVAAEMATVVTGYFIQRQEHQKVIAMSDVVLAHYPKEASSMVWKGAAYGQLIGIHFEHKYPMPKLIPPKEYGYFKYLEEQNRYWFAKAEALGWRKADPDHEAKYLESINRVKSTQ